MEVCSLLMLLMPAEMMLAESLPLKMGNAPELTRVSCRVILLLLMQNEPFKL